MKKMMSTLLLFSAFILLDLQGENCKTSTCSVDLLISPEIIGKAKSKKTHVPCETGFAQKGSNVLKVEIKKGNEENSVDHCPKISGISKKVKVKPGKSYCITAIGKTKHPHPSVKIHLHEKGGKTLSSKESFTSNFQIITLNFVAKKSHVYVSLGTKSKHKNAHFEVQKFTLEACRPCTFTPLNILLTNDDGATDVGIQALKTVFTAAGHNVFLVAPSGSIDATSAAVNSPILVPPQFELLTQIAPNEWAVSIVNNPHAPTPVGPAFPVTALASAPLVIPAGTKIDLVISGINAEGLNTGPAANISGTVSAARIAVTDYSSQFPPTPAIAISSGGNKSAAFVTQVATFVLSLVTQLQCSDFAKRNGQLLPPLTALNVNYPNLPVNQIAGVKVTRQGLVATAGGPPQGVQSVALAKLSPNLILSVLEPANLAAVKDFPDSDSLAVLQGYISVEPVSGDLTAASCATEQIIDVIPRLSLPAYGTYLPEATVFKYCPKDK